MNNEMINDLISRIELQINTTPSGEHRNTLTDVNILLHDLKQKVNNNLLYAVSPDMEAERYTYKNVLLQRLNKDRMWYAIYNNQIINWSQYRHDLESWIDKYITS
jgi:hypothetical protein